MTDPEFPSKPCPCPPENTAGMEVSGVYDGVLYWFCLDCGQAFQRWGADSRLNELAEPYIARHNAGHPPVAEGRIKQ